MTGTGGRADAAVRTFLRPARGVAETAADLLRIAAVVGVPVAFLGWGPVAAAVMGLALTAAMAPRFLGFRPALDAACTAVVGVAAWSSVVGLYQSVLWWDVPMHLLANGVIAAGAVVAADRLGARVDVRPVPLVLLVLVTGLAAGALWEFGEWAGHTLVDEAILVGYDDTVLDMAVGGLGALALAPATRWLGDRSRWQGDARAAAAPRREAAPSSP